MKQRLARVFALISLASLFHGCYVVPIEQGNTIKTHKVQQLKRGMSKEQVRYIMGSVALESAFDDDTWDYVYTLRDSRRRLSHQHVHLRFKNNRLVTIKQ